MNFQMYQTEKSQALDLLDRVQSRLLDMLNKEDGEYDLNQALCDVCDLYRQVSVKRTQLSLMNIDAETLANLLRNYDDTKRGTAVDFFATYFSNFNTSVDEFKLAASFPLQERDQLLRQCVHGVDIATECCLPCDVGKTMMGLLNTVSRLEIVRR